MKDIELPPPLGYMNAGHVHELQQGRLHYGYTYPKGGTGAEEAVFTADQLRAAVGADRERIKDGIMALAMTAERCEEDGPEVQTAIKSFAFRVGLMIDGHEDLVMNDAAKTLFGSLQETRSFRNPSFKEDELKEMERYIEKITKDPRAAREFLIRAEIIDENGDLARHFRQPEDES